MGENPSPSGEDFSSIIYFEKRTIEQRMKNIEVSKVDIY